jgi:hypothetical protein
VSVPQVRQLDLPERGWYLPAVHGGHAEAPSVALNLPAGQVVHSVASDELNLPTAHLEHEPLEVLYLPAGQEAPPLPLLSSSSSPPPPPEEHLTHSPDPAVEHIPDAQAVHEAPPDWLYVSVPQVRQLDLPG